MIFRRLLSLLFVFLSSGIFATEIVVENPAGFFFYSPIHYDTTKNLENRKDVIVIFGRSINLVVYSKAWIEDGLVVKLKLEKRFDFLSSFKNLMLINGQYLSQEQLNRVIAPMDSMIYNLEYFPSKKNTTKFYLESRKISPCIFGNNYWPESYIKQTFGFVKNTAIKMIRRGRIYRDKTKRNQENLDPFKELVDYTEVAFLIQPGYLADKSVKNNSKRGWVFSLDFSSSGSGNVPHLKKL